MFVLPNSKILCSKESSHRIPNFIVNGKELHLEEIELLKEFRVICDKNDVTSYTLITDTSLEFSPITEFLLDMEERYAKELQKHVPLRFLDILSQTESQLVLDFRYGVSIGWRRLFEDFVAENFGVLIYGKPKGNYRDISTHYGFISNKDLASWKQHANLLLEALVKTPILPKNEKRGEIREILKGNKTLQDSLLDQKVLTELVQSYGRLSSYIHGDSSEPSQKYLEDALVLILSSCLDYFNQGMKWGTL